MRMPVDVGAPRALEGVAAVGDDPRQVRERLDVVDDRRLQVQALGRREVRRLEPGHAPLALEALDERRLLAHDVGAGTPRQRDVDAEVGAEDVLADQAVGVGVVQGLGDALLGQRHLAPHVEEGLRGVDGVAGEDDALDELVRIELHEQPVLVGAGLALVAVDDDVAREHVGRQEAPLRARREAGAAPAQHVDVLTSSCTCSGVISVRALRSGDVAAGADVAVVGVAVGHVEAAA